MAQPAVAPQGRIPGLETIKALPIFFAINDKRHPHSVMIVERLQKSYPERCVLFETVEKAAAQFNATTNAVLIFDDERAKGCFSQFFRGKQPCPTLWGVGVNRHLESYRVDTVVNQLRADFDKKFFERLNEGRLPWGDHESPTNSRKRRGLIQKHSPRRGRRERYSCF